MLTNDGHFNSIITATFGSFPFRPLNGRVHSHDTIDAESLYASFINLFHAQDALDAKNILFFWAVESPFQHADGNRMKSTISYIEISKGSLAGRWPKRFFRNLTRDYTNKGEVSAYAGLQELADKDKNLAFYTQLIREHGPLRVWYATLGELNSAARGANCPEWESVRDCERCLIKAYRGVHGSRRRPLKNRQD